MDIVDLHLSRVRSSLLSGYSLDNLPRWICDNTYIKGEPYSFTDHEFQERILSDPAPEKVVRKCSQIGLSETTVRAALGMVNSMPGFTAIYTLPTASFAEMFTKTRIDPVIETSPELLAKIDSETDSSKVKKFGSSFLYIRGTKGAAAPISVPADALIHDELDFSDLTVTSNYQSRLTHSKWKLKWKFSTPTVDGWGISHEFAESKRHWQFVTCTHCNESFVPDYFKNVRVPGYAGRMQEITAEIMWQIRWREAYVACPKCGEAADLSPENREWVVENNDYQGDTHGYQITPFDAPAIIRPRDLIAASLKYERQADFINFGLGLPAEDLETGLSEMELDAMFSEAGRFMPYSHVMGIDVGMTCHLMVSGVGADGQMDVVHTETVNHTQLEKRKGELRGEFRVRATVMDSQPYYDLLVRLQGKDPNLWGALYTTSKSLEVFSLGDQEKDKEKGEERVRQVKINRNRGFDSLMAFMRSNGLRFRTATHKDKVKAHLQDMKRVRDLTNDDELVFSWKKSATGNDHFHHALLYTYIASRLLGAASSSLILPFLAASVSIPDKKSKDGILLPRQF